jgi:hypothetical protein
MQFIKKMFSYYHIYNYHFEGKLNEWISAHLEVITNKKIHTILTHKKELKLGCAYISHVTHSHMMSIRRPHFPNPYVTS